ncbi:DUF2975 domain-containing protein [Fusibacter bizertensis]|uniref:DUF2975 domain-containing protein n=1 Tax=Fusibacter bizertensis TaxID=1488331 RepID=A0ABT6NGL4_9FIRM|nr:DUF2975 domain-containing protein [Fusibacter bizertensis]MDH8679578.1 DUF2975 domain-containing protein [Fusibacter bizertensis]
MSEEQLFTKKAKTLKIIFLLIFIGISLQTAYGFIFPVMQVFGLTEGYTYNISYDGTSPESALSTTIRADALPYIHLSRDILIPKTTYKYSEGALFSRIVVISTIFRLPTLLVLWLTYSLFREIAKSSTPFTKEIYRKLSFLGFVLILIGIFNNALWSTVLNTVITGSLILRFNINFYLILMGFIIYVVSEILQYGTYLQTEMDTLL